MKDETAPFVFGISNAFFLSEQQFRADHGRCERKSQDDHGVVARFGRFGRVLRRGAECVFRRYGVFFRAALFCRRRQSEAGRQKDRRGDKTDRLFQDVLICFIGNSPFVIGFAFLFPPI